VITAREAVVSVAGSGGVAQIGVIGSLSAKHFKIARGPTFFMRSPRDQVRCSSLARDTTFPFPLPSGAG
jgi:hypothetical protein